MWVPEIPEFLGGRQEELQVWSLKKNKDGAKGERKRGFPQDRQPHVEGPWEHGALGNCIFSGIKKWGEERASLSCFSLYLN